MNGCYNAAESWHANCRRGAGRSLRRRNWRRAFEEWWDYLYPRALYRLHDANKAQDATQQALVKIFRKRTTCREPGNFLRWGEQVLVHEIFERFRKEYERRLTERGIEYAAHEMRLDDLGTAANEESNQSEEFLADPKQDTPEQAFRCKIGSNEPSSRQKLRRVPAPPRKPSVWTIPSRRAWRANMRSASPMILRRCSRC